MQNYQHVSFFEKKKSKNEVLFESSNNSKSQFVCSIISLVCEVLSKV